MITKRLLVVALFLALGLGCVFLVPSSARLQPAGIVLNLPTQVGSDWIGQDVEVTEKERVGLASDTGFVRKLYTNRNTGDQIFVGIVLSGEDMANSIHRPERCLIAQGWAVADSQTRLVPGAPSAAPSVEIKRLVHSRPVKTTDGKPFNYRNVTYYWFIGSHDRTASHWQRTFFDIRDRLVYGENQRWAYVTIATAVTEGIRHVVKDAQGRQIELPQRSEEQASKIVEEFIPQVLPSFERRGAGEPIAGL